MIYYTPDDRSERRVSLFEKNFIPFVYHPIDGITPSELGVIIDERVNMVDIYAEIFELARQGFVDVKKLSELGFEKLKDEYCFIKTTKTLDEVEIGKLKNHQRYLLRELFRFSNYLRSFQYLCKKYDIEESEIESIGKKISQKKYVLYEGLRYHFHESLSGYTEKLYDNMVHDGFFYTKPNKVRKVWLMYYLIMNSVVFLIIYMNSFAINQDVVVFTCLLIPGFILSYLMPNKTSKGYSYYRQATGLKWYLNKSMWKSDTLNKRMFVDAIFPFAVALGVSRSLVNDIKKLAISPPQYMGDENSFYKLIGSIFVARL